ncbi:hypothetical protein A2U01_0054829, partial [Trifolium medium]|nr:hypothetical protein [Trifolium medium]
MATSELRKLALGYGVKGVVLTHLLSARQEKEASDARVRADRVEKTVADVESRYNEAKGKLLEEIEGLKRAKEDEAAKFKKEKDEALAKARTDHAGEVDMLKKKHAEEKALLERERTLLTLTRNAVIVSLAQAGRDMLALQEYA